MVKNSMSRREGSYYAGPARISIFGGRAKENRAPGGTPKAPGKPGALNAAKARPQAEKILPRRGLLCAEYKVFVSRIPPGSRGREPFPAQGTANGDRVPHFFPFGGRPMDAPAA